MRFLRGFQILGDFQGVPEIFRKFLEFQGFPGISWERSIFSGLFEIVGDCQGFLAIIREFW